MRYRRWPVVVALVLAGCGFHLRGALPELTRFEPVRLDGALRHPELTRALQEAFIGARVSVDDAAAVATTVVIRGETLDRRVLSVAGDGQPVEYELRYVVELDIRTAAGQLYPVNLVLLRRYGFDASRLLAIGAEESILAQDMRREAAQAVLQRMRALAQP